MAKARDSLAFRSLSWPTLVPPIVLDFHSPRASESEHGTKYPPPRWAQGSLLWPPTPHLLGIFYFTGAKSLVLETSLGQPDHQDWHVIIVETKLILSPHLLIACLSRCVYSIPDSSNLSQGINKFLPIGTSVTPNGC